jgi:hypothetical protein
MENRESMAVPGAWEEAARGSFHLVACPVFSLALSASVAKTEREVSGSWVGAKKESSLEAGTAASSKISKKGAGLALGSAEAGAERERCCCCCCWEARERCREEVEEAARDMPESAGRDASASARSGSSAFLSSSSAFLSQWRLMRLTNCL